MIYLDHAAATPLSKHAFEVMKPYFDTEFFNPSAAYLPAQKTRYAYEAAKDEIAHVIGAKGVGQILAGSNLIRDISAVKNKIDFHYLLTSSRPRLM